MDKRFYELYIDAGSTYSKDIAVANSQTGLRSNIDGYTARSSARRYNTSLNVSISFTATVSDPGNGVVTLSLTANQSSNVRSGTHVFDVELVSNTTSVVYRVAEGIITVSPEITR